MGGGGSGTTTPPPDQPNWIDLFGDGLEVMMDNAPELAAMEYDLRSQYGPKYAALAAQLYGQLAPKLAKTNLATLKKIDPQSIAIRDQLFGAVRDDLALGYELDPKMKEQLTATIRGAQAARGNVLGPSPVAAEGLYVGEAAQRLRQQRLSNASGFLQGWKPQDSFGSLLGAGAAPAMNVIAGNTGPTPIYTDPDAGWKGVQAGQSEFAQQFAVWQAAQGAAGSQSNPWMGALGGAASGASAGAAAGPYGAIIGALIGGGLGYAGAS